MSESHFLSMKYKKYPKNAFNFLHFALRYRQDLYGMGVKITNGDRIKLGQGVKI